MIEFRSSRVPFPSDNENCTAGAATRLIPSNSSSILFFNPPDSVNPAAGEFSRGGGGGGDIDNRYPREHFSLSPNAICSSRDPLSRSSWRQFVTRIERIPCGALRSRCNYRKCVLLIDKVSMEELTWVNTRSATCMKFNSQIRANAHQDLGWLLLLYKWCADRKAGPRGSLRAHGTVHGGGD